MNSNNRSRTAEARRRGLFDRISGHYNRFNHVTSLGVDIWWRRQALKRISPGKCVLDVGCGGGQMLRVLEKKFPVRVGLDPSISMLKSGNRNRQGYSPVQGAGEWLPFHNGAFDRVVSGFVMRNLTDLRLAMREMHRVLHHGGSCILLDFFPPSSRLMRGLFSLYLGRIVPRIYHWMTGRGEDAQWLHDSIRGFVNVDEFRRLLSGAGFVDVKSRGLLFGLARCIEARKP